MNREEALENKTEKIMRQHPFDVFREVISGKVYIQIMDCWACLRWILPESNCFCMDEECLEAGEGRPHKVNGNHGNCDSNCPFSGEVFLRIPSSSNEFPLYLCNKCFFSENGTWGDFEVEFTRADFEVKPCPSRNPNK